MKKPQPKVGRPAAPDHLIRTHRVYFNDVEQEAFEKLGYSLVDGVRTAVAEFIAARGGRYESK